jgi:hypothetical protein
VDVLIEVAKAGVDVESREYQLRVSFIYHSFVQIRRWISFSHFYLLYPGGLVPPVFALPFADTYLTFPSPYTAKLRKDQSRHAYSIS